MTKTKRCTECGKTKSLGAFYKDGRFLGGRRNDCKICLNKAKRARGKKARTLARQAQAREFVSACRRAHQDKLCDSSIREAIRRHRKLYQMTRPLCILCYERKTRYA